MSNTSELPEEPTIEWLIDQIAPNPGNSPLLNFNKQRLQDLIAAQRQRWEAEARKDELWELLDYVTRTSYDTSTGQKMDKYLNERITALDGELGKEQ